MGYFYVDGSVYESICLGYKFIILSKEARASRRVCLLSNVINFHNSHSLFFFFIFLPGVCSSACLWRHFI